MGNEGTKKRKCHCLAQTDLTYIMVFVQSPAKLKEGERSWGGGGGRNERNIHQLACNEDPDSAHTNRQLLPILTNRQSSNTVLSYTHSNRNKIIRM